MSGSEKKEKLMTKPEIVKTLSAAVLIALLGACTDMSHSTSRGFATNDTWGHDGIKDPYSDRIR
jgi:hypothetical protein